MELIAVRFKLILNHEGHEGKEEWNPSVLL